LEAHAGIRFERIVLDLTSDYMKGAVTFNHNCKDGRKENENLL
jgi:hypothetical protein